MAVNWDILAAPAFLSPGPDRPSPHQSLCVRVSYDRRPAHRCGIIAAGGIHDSRHLPVTRTLNGVTPVNPPRVTGRDRALSAAAAPDLVRELEELIAALDRRVPRVEEAGELLIARDAAALRAKAVERLAELLRTTVRPPTSVADPT